jgi:hypothetical protein
MSVSSTGSSPRRGHSKLEEWLDKLLGKREKYEARIAAANAKKAARLAKAEKRWQKEVGKAPEKLARIDEELTAFLERNRYSLTRRLSKTIKRALGEVKVTLHAVELDMPRDETPVANFLLKRRGGKRYLTFTPKVNRRALLQASSELMSALAPLGVARAKHWMISVRSPSSERARTLSRQRYNDHSRQRRSSK